MDNQTVVAEIYSHLVGRLRGVLHELNKELGDDPHGELRNDLVIFAIDRRSEDRSERNDAMSWVHQAAIDLLHGRPD